MGGGGTNYKYSTKDFFFIDCIYVFVLVQDQVNKFNDLEKLLLYLKLPAGIPEGNAATNNKK